MKRINKSIGLLLAAFLLSACATNDKEDDFKPDQDQTPPVENSENEAETPKEEEIEVADLRDFFLPDDSKAEYEGVGNEFAELKIEVHHIGDEFIVVDEDNGGVTIRKIYRIEEDQIATLSENPIDLNEPLPDAEELNKLEQKDTYLKTPLAVGEKFGDWVVVETEGTVETPYDSFDNVLIIESVNDDFTNRRYLVPEYGEVVRESIMETEDEEDFIVISSLKTIE